MASSILMNKIISINDMNRIKEIIQKHMNLNRFYTHTLNGEKLYVINDARLVSAIVQLPLYINADRECCINYDENARLLQKWLCQYESSHGIERIAQIASQLFAESIYLIREIGYPPYFNFYKNLVLEILAYDDSSRKFLNNLLNKDVNHESL